MFFKAVPLLYKYIGTPFKATVLCLGREFLVFGKPEPLKNKIR